jgi:beta-glucosidase
MPDPEDLLTRLTLEEKASLLTGRNFWETESVERLGVPSVTVTDGPNGARGDGILGTGLRALCIPCGSALGATWNPDLVEELGTALAVEARDKGARVLLAPTINIHRSPLGGRNFECYSEDPELTGRLAVSFIRGVQGQGVATTPKHYVANESEFERNTIDSVVPERALREIYLRPFELAVREGGAWGLMAAYNRINGTFACEHRRLLTEVLRDEWGFDGFVVSDWLATRSTTDSIRAGLDLEMPGPGPHFGAALAQAVGDGQVDPAVLDDAVRHILLLLERTDAFDEPPSGPEEEVDRPEHRALVRRAAAEAMVLLTNDDLLPLDVGGLGSLAVIGPNADRAQIMGGGSSKVRPRHRTSPLEALQTRLGDSVAITFEPGCRIDRSYPPVPGHLLTAASGEAGVDIESFDGEAWEGPPVSWTRRDDTQLVFASGPPGLTDPSSFSFRAAATFTPRDAGLHTFTLVQLGRARLRIGGRVVLDGVVEPPLAGTDYLGLGSAEIETTVQLPAGDPVDLEIEYTTTGSLFLRGVKIGYRPPVVDDAIDRAARAAASCDAAVLVVGTNDDWETEGRDRESMDLPGEQDELIRRVVAANRRTVVVVNAGSPVTMPWADEAAALLHLWFGGQEMGDALVDVLTGEVDPSGRLPTTFPVRYEDHPAYLDYPGENGEARYGEGVFVGYRYYEAKGVRPRFPFGHGLSYTGFALEPPDLPREAIRAGEGVSVAVPVENTGDRRGAEVVQCYVRPLEPRLARPPQELKAFAKVELEPGERRQITLDLDERAFAYYDPGDPDAPEAGLVPVGRGVAHRTEPGWYTDPGRYELRIGTSSEAIAHVRTVTVADGEAR